jgi:MFS family permease
LEPLQKDAPSSLSPLYASVFLVSLGLGAYLFLLPVYVQLRGGTYLDLGVVGMVRSAAYMVLPLLAGYLSDRLGALRLYLFSVAVNALAAGALVLAGSVLEIIMIQVLSGIGFAFLWPTTETLVASSSEAPQRVRAIGRYSISWALGFLLGPLLGGYLAENLGYTTLFLMASATILGSSLLLIRFGGGGPLPAEAMEAQSFWDLRLLRPALPLYMMVVPYSIIFGLLVAIFPGYLSNLGVRSQEIGFLFSLFGVARITAFFYAHRVTALGERRVVAGSFAAFALALVVIVHATRLVDFGLSMVLMGLSTGIFYPVTAALVSQMVPRGKLGTAMGAYENFFGLGFTVGPLAGGALATLWSPSSPYLVMAIMSLSMLPALLLWRPPPRS